MKYKIGDKVKIVKNLSKHGYEYGEIVKIVNVLNFAYIGNDSDSGMWCFTDDECEFYSRSNYIRIIRERKYFFNTRVKIINIEPHKAEKKYICLDEYLGKTGTTSGYYYTEDNVVDDIFCINAIDFDEEYMNVVDKKNERLRYQKNQIEFLDKRR